MRAIRAVALLVALDTGMPALANAQNAEPMPRTGGMAETDQLAALQQAFETAFARSDGNAAAAALAAIHAIQEKSSGPKARSR